MIQRNIGFSNLTAGYLFPEVARRRREYAASHPQAKIISLGIGNTTEPLSPHIAKAMADYCLALATPEGYSGYGDEQGNSQLRAKIAEVFYPGMATAEEIFISDGAKCDIARIQTLFGSKVKVAVQDPAYPVYVDGSVVVCAAGKNTGNGYEGISYLPCTPENNFFPDLSKIEKNTLIYFCSPNNPTGATATREQLQTLVDFANKNGCIIIFDAAYFAFIRDKNLPKTIYEIPGAKTCAIEVNSFSKQYPCLSCRTSGSYLFIGAQIVIDTNLHTSVFCSSLFRGVVGNRNIFAPAGVLDFGRVKTGGTYQILIDCQCSAAA